MVRLVADNSPSREYFVDNHLASYNSKGFSNMAEKQALKSKCYHPKCNRVKMPLSV